MSHPVRTKPIYHRMDCDCASCEPDGPAIPSIEQAGNETIVGSIAGFLLGWVIVFFWDLLAGGPGMFVGFGL